MLLLLFLSFQFLTQKVIELIFGANTDIAQMAFQAIVLQSYLFVVGLYGLRLHAYLCGAWKQLLHLHHLPHDEVLLDLAPVLVELGLYFFVPFQLFLELPVAVGAADEVADNFRLVELVDHVVLASELVDAATLVQLFQ